MESFSAVVEGRVSLLTCLHLLPLFVRDQISCSTLLDVAFSSNFDPTHVMGGQ